MTPRPAPVRTPRRALVAVLLVLALGLLPMPFNIVFADEPVATVWRLDGRLMVNGRSANPQGRWSFVAVGRPELLAETVTKRAFGRERSRNIRIGPDQQRPIYAEPLAVAAGLRQAGRIIDVQPVLFVTNPTTPNGAVTLVAVNGSKHALVELVAQLPQLPVAQVIDDTMEFTTATGESLRFSDEERDVSQFRPGEVLLDDVQAKIRWRMQRFVPQTWFRSMAVGNSHGLMVALVTYAHTADPALARGLHVAGSGAVNADGMVSNVGGLRAKAKAAHRAGADVFFFPAAQASLLDSRATPNMQLVPVEHVADALHWLQQARQHG